MAPSISKAAGKKPLVDEEDASAAVSDIHQSAKKLRAHFKKVAAGKKTVAPKPLRVPLPSPPMDTATAAGGCTHNFRVAKKRMEQDDTIAILERALANLRAEVALNRKRVAAFEALVKRAFLARLHLICTMDINPDQDEENRMQGLVANWLSHVLTLLRDPPAAVVKTLLLVRQVTQSDISCKEWPDAAAEAIEELDSYEELQTPGGKLLLFLASMRRY